MLWTMYDNWNSKSSYEELKEINDKLEKTDDPEEAQRLFQLRMMKAMELSAKYATGRRYGLYPY